jgi:NAD-dependent deacetylase
MKDAIIRAAEIIQNSSYTIALTGAGVSVESGIPDFRSSGGLWEKYDPAIYASIESFRHKPEMVWEMLFDMVDIMERAPPNPAPYALARMEELGFLSSGITQKIDNLHQAAGSRHVIEYHGNASRLECLSCGRKYGHKEIFLSVPHAPRCATCNAVLKPTVIFFGEMIPYDAMTESNRIAARAEAVIVAGTSAIVYPAAGIPLLAKENNAAIIEFNVEPTALTEYVTDVFVQGPAGVTLNRVLEILENK